MLAIRMQRLGRKGHPMYRIVVQDSKWAPTSGKYVAMLGSHNPHDKSTTLVKEKAEFYLKNGARPSERVVKLFQNEGVKLPKWVSTEFTKKTKSTKNPEKLRKNRPAEPVEEVKDSAESSEESVDEKAQDSGEENKESESNKDASSGEEKPEEKSKEQTEEPEDSDKSDESKEEK